jgi:hypothetical protein
MATFDPKNAQLWAIFLFLWAFSFEQLCSNANVVKRRHNLATIPTILV